MLWIVILFVSVHLNAISLLEFPVNFHITLPDCVIETFLG